MKSTLVLLFLPILKRKFNLALLLIFSLLLLSCDKKTENKADGVHEKESVKLYVDSDDCAIQLEGINNSKNIRLLFFDSKGMFDENSYKQSPSARIKNLIKSDLAFKKLAEKHFDFVIVSQACEIGKGLSLKYGVQSFPEFLLIDQKGSALYKHIPIFSIEKVKSELNEKFN